MKRIQSTSREPIRRPIFVLGALVLAWLSACGRGSSNLEQGLVPLNSEGRPIPPEAGPADLSPQAQAQRERPDFHDFGLVPLGERAEHTFRLLNTDALPVTIQRMDPSCGCASARASYVADDGQRVAGGEARGVGILDVPPGRVVELVMGIDTAQIHTKNEHKSLSIKLITSSPHRPFLAVEAHVIADSPLQFTAEDLNFGRIPQGSESRAGCEIVSVGPSGLRPKGLATLPPGMRAELSRAERFGQPLWTLQVWLTPPLELGPLRGELRLTTEVPAHPPGPGVDPEHDPATQWMPGRDFSLKFAAQVVPDVELFPAQLVARARAQAGAQGASELISHLPGQRLRVTGGTIEGPLADWLELSWTPEAPDDSGQSPTWRIELTAKAGCPQEQASGKGVLLLDDAQFPRLEFGWVLRLD